MAIPRSEHCPICRAVWHALDRVALDQIQAIGGQPVGPDAQQTAEHLLQAVMIWLVQAHFDLRGRDPQPVIQDLINAFNQNGLTGFARVIEHQLDGMDGQVH